LWEAEKKMDLEGRGKDGAGKMVKGKEKKREGLAEYVHLLQKLKSSTPGSLSFFVWFGFRGRDVSAEESADAVRKEQERRARIKKGEKIPIELDDDDDDNNLGEGDDTDDEGYEIFPLGDELAISITEDLYPGAIKYFSKPFTLSLPLLRPPLLFPLFYPSRKNIYPRWSRAVPDSVRI